MSEIKVVSLFSGCGGMDLGIEGGFSFLGKKFRRTDFNIVWANDIDEYACETYRNNFNESECICDDIAKEKIWKSMPKKCDMVIGGFPCQDFSLTRATRREGVKVKRGELYKYFVKTVSEKRPKVFMAENVKGILSANKGEAIGQITKEFAHIDGGYNIYCDLYKFVEYGVPQIRERVLIIGVRSDIEYSYTKPKGVGESNYVNSKKALANIGKKAFNHDFMRSADRTRRILEAIPEGKNIKYLSPNNPLHVKGLMSNIYRRLDRSKPSTTIIAGGGGGTWGYHYQEPRALTNRERARIQSFPDDFEFIGTNTEVRRQIGNAVPPVGIHAVALELKKVFVSQKGSLKKAVTINICGTKTIERLRR